MNRIPVHQATEVHRQEASNFLIAQEGRLLRTGDILALVEEELRSAALSVRHAREKLLSSGSLSLEEQAIQKPWSDSAVEDLLAQSDRRQKEKHEAGGSKRSELGKEVEEEKAEEDDENDDDSDVDWEPRSEAGPSSRSLSCSKPRQRAKKAKLRHRSSKSSKARHRRTSR